MASFFYGLFGAPDGVLLGPLLGAPGGDGGFGSGGVLGVGPPGGVGGVDRGLDVQSFGGVFGEINTAPTPLVRYFFNLGFTKAPASILSSMVLAATVPCCSISWLI